MSDEIATKPIINDTRDEVRLGDLLFEYDEDKNLLSVVNALDGEEVIFAAGERCFPEVWESMVVGLERLMHSGPLLSALRQIERMGDDAKEREDPKAPAAGSQDGDEHWKQVGLHAHAVAEQVLAELERTSPPKEDVRHVSTLEAGSSGLHGVAPQDVMAALEDEAASMSARVEALNWQVTKFGEHRVIFVIYSYKGEQEPVGGELRTREGLRVAIHVDGKGIYGGSIGKSRFGE